jgi:NADPH2:quinone reductase
MRAAWYSVTGPARDVFTLGEIPAPEPGPGEVRVRLHTSGVNPSDAKSRSGATGRNAGHQRVIPHSDGAGIIDMLGDGVPGDRLGRRVWVHNAQFMRPFGTAAEYVTLPEQLTVTLPETTDFAAGACLGIPALTAYHAVAGDVPVTGQTVLVCGGAGAVGHYAVQIAKLKGATVVATVSSDEKAAHARDAGADHTINYRTDDVALRLMDLTAGRGADRIIDVDTTVNARLLPQMIAPSGTIASYGAKSATATLPVRDLRNKNATMRFILVYALSREQFAAIIADVTALLEAERLKHAIARRFPLAEIAAAHEAVESGSVIGNVVLDIG